MTADWQDVTQLAIYLRRLNIRRCSIVSSAPEEWGGINLRGPSQSSLKCPQSVVNTESLHRTFQHTVHCVHICCVAAQPRSFCLSTGRLTWSPPDHLLLPRAPPPLSRKGLAQYGRSCAPDLLPLSLLRRLVLFGRSSPTRLVPASAPTHRISGHRQWARGNRSSRAASEYVSLVQFVFISF